MLVSFLLSFKFCSVAVNLILLLALSYVINVGNVGCGLLVPCIILIVY